MLQLSLFERAILPDGDDWRAVVRDSSDGTQNLLLTDWQLPELLSIVVVDGPAAPTDLRAVLKGVARDHLGVGDRELADIVFPDSAKVRPLSNLIA